MFRLIALSFFSFLLLLPLHAQQEWEKRTQEAFKQGKLEEARRQAQAGLDNSSSRGIANEWLGRIDFQERKYEAAIENFQKANSEGRFTTEMVRDWSSALTKLNRNP